ncbi:hypothetical protein CERSUDRAFT_93504 [Gelatoporia subvermispora B]|uniref:Uncharacterized protein n=1 Tax=Ceriporiopsis subvermispora (strain B) TaxID=914234 RepID=M2PNI6_CERS8|nr:hypothetical protein CERSUDRAFT_93504 [Gelatoporia subvermispora B]
MPHTLHTPILHRKPSSLIISFEHLTATSRPNTPPLTGMLLEPPPESAMATLLRLRQQWNAVHALRRGSTAFGQRMTWTVTSEPRVKIQEGGLIVLVDEEDSRSVALSASVTRVWKREQFWTVFYAEGAHLGGIYLQVPHEWVHMPWYYRGPLARLLQTLDHTIPPVPANRNTAARLAQVRRSRHVSDTSLEPATAIPHAITPSPSFSSVDPTEM